METYVRDVMTQAAAAVRPGASLVEAAQLMRAQDIGGVLVVNDARLLGVLTDRDIALRVVAEGVDPLSVNCWSVCTPDPVTIGQGAEAGIAVELMRTHAVRRLPVLDHDRPTGVVSLGDLARDRDPDSALAAISRAVPDTVPGDAGPRTAQEGAGRWIT